MELKGTYTAMITPFKEDVIDEEGFRQNIQFQIQAGISGLVFLGTTAEAMTLTQDEKKRIIEIGVEEGKGRVTLIVGTGSNCTKTTLEQTKQAADLGADAALVVTPYYIRPNQEGVYKHFQEVASDSSLPLIIYNIPGRTGISIEISTLLRLTEFPSIIGIKESNKSFQKSDEMIRTVRKKAPSFSILSGDDLLNFPLIALGASGTISVLSNLIPKEMTTFIQTCLEGDSLKARKLHQKFSPLYEILSLDVNPIPIKEAMRQCGMPTGGYRLPLCQINPEKKKKLEESLMEFGLD